MTIIHAHKSTINLDNGRNKNTISTCVVVLVLFTGV